MECVAIMWFKNGSLSGLSESQLKNEVLFLCQLHHPNIMPLIGFCIQKDPQLILSHEYMLNGSFILVIGAWWSSVIIAALRVLTRAPSFASRHDAKPKIFGLSLSKRVGPIDLASLSLVARNHDSFAYCHPEYATASNLAMKSNVFFIWGGSIGSGECKAGERFFFGT
ncbi:hypothetical protein JHK87_022275 [Glycine soja]|nr:hypothetical protein JHK87_022275 [Glycine soja]